MKNIFKFICVFVFLSNTVHGSSFSGDSLSVVNGSSVNETLTKNPVRVLLKNGPIKALFIGPMDSGGLMSFEISSRIEAECVTVSTGTREKLGLNNNGGVFSDSSVTSDILTAISKDCDVIYLDFKIENMPQNIITALKQKISLGTGLVCAGAKNDYKLLKIKKTSGVKSLNEKTCYGISAFETGKIKKGRVVIISQPERFKTVKDRGDYFNFAVNTFIYASGRNYGTVLLNVELPIKTIEHEIIGISNYMVHITRTVPDDSMKVTAKYRNERGERIAEISHFYVIKKGRSFVLMDFPPMPVGRYSVDIIVSDSQGAIAFAGNIFEVDTKEKISDVTLWNTSASAGGFFAGTISSSFEYKQGIVVTAELTDYWDRTIDKYTLETVTGRRNVDFIFKVNNRYSKLMELKVKLYKNNELVSLIVKDLFFEKNRKTSDFSLGILDFPLSPFLESKDYRALSRAGADIIAPDYSTGISCMQAASNMRDIMSGNMDVLPLLETFSHPDSTIIDKAPGMVDSLKGLSPYGYSILINSEKEKSLSPFKNVIDSINATISSKDTSAVIAVLNLNGELYSEDKILKSKINPAIISGSKNPNYRESLFPAQENAYGKSSAGLAYIPEYSNSSDETLIRRFPWFALFNGFDSVWWKGIYGLPDAALNQEFVPSESFSIMAEECSKIKRGIDRLILESPLKNNGIAIIDGYNPSESKNENRDVCSLYYQTFKKLGYNPSVIHGNSFSNGFITLNDIGLIILLSPENLSKDIYDTLESFISSGGNAVAFINDNIVKNGLGDSRESIENVFGVSLSGNGELIEKASIKPLLADDKLLLKVAVNNSIMIPLGKSESSLTIAEINGKPSITKRINGKGAAYFLNFMPGTVYNSPENLLKWCISNNYTQIPYFTTEGTAALNPEDLSVSFFSDNGARYVAVVPEIKSGKANEKNQKFFLNMEGIEKKYFIYDVLEKNFLGSTNKVEVNFSKNGAGLFALLPYRVRSVDINIPNSMVNIGGKINFTVKVVSQEAQSKPVRHVVIVELYDPSGRIIPCYSSEIEFSEWLYEGELQLTENEKPGRWIIKVTDTVSGKQAERAFVIRPEGSVR